MLANVAELNRYTPAEIWAWACKTVAKKSNIENTSNFFISINSWFVSFLNKDQTKLKNFKIQISKPKKSTAYYIIRV